MGYYDKPICTSPVVRRLREKAVQAWNLQSEGWNGVASNWTSVKLLRQMDFCHYKARLSR